MIAEAIEWCVTPCPWFARRRGLLAAQIGIRHRARRCLAAWRPHLDACRKFVAEALEADDARGHLVILGSGHLNDFDLAFLQGRFERITLVDAVHPLEIQIRAWRSGGRLNTVAADLSEPDRVVEALVGSADWVVSSCLLSQLPLFAGEGADGSVGRHWDLMRRVRRWVLITDVAERRIGGGAWEWLFDTGPLPQPDDEWIWTIAPPGERDLVGAERRVWAFRG
jgi:hypothetical protein